MVQKSSVKIIEEFTYLLREAMATKEKMYSGFYMSPTWMHRIYCIIQTMIFYATALEHTST